MPTADELLAQSKAMELQTQAQGATPFAGSTYDTPTITAASLTPQKPVEYQTTPPIQVPVVTPYQLTPEEQTAVTQETDLSKLIAGLTAETSTPFQEDARLKAEQAQGIAEKKSKLASFQNTQKALQAEAEGIDLQLAQDLQNVSAQNQDAYAGRGIAKGIVGIKGNQATRQLQTVANQAKLAVAIKQFSNNASMAAAQGDLTSALDYVDRAIQAEFLPKEKALAVAQANLTNLQKSTTLTSAQQKLADASQKEIDAEKEKLATEKKNAQDTQDAKIKAFSVFTNNPKFTPAVIAQLNAAKTPLDVAGILQYNGLSTEKPSLENLKLDNGETVIWDKMTGKIVSRLGGAKPEAGTPGVSGTEVSRDAESVMNGTLNLQDISVKDNYRAGVAAELTALQKKALEKGDMAGVMRSSAAYDKEPSDTFLQSMEKTLSVVSQLGALQDSIATANTGPIVGAFRNANPWDTQAQTIKAQLNAIVPNLARGVYGEVGVLTDNDIKQYAKTIPTLTSTEDIRNAILYITLDQIRKNVEIKIKNQASGQRDMSGYADVYENLNTEVSNILSTLPQGKKTVGNTPLSVGSTGKTSSGVTWTIEE